MISWIVFFVIIIFCTVYKSTSWIDTYIPEILTTNPLITESYKSTTTQLTYFHYSVNRSYLKKLRLNSWLFLSSIKSADSDRMIRQQCFNWRSSSAVLQDLRDRTFCRVLRPNWFNNYTQRKQDRLSMYSLRNSFFPRK